MILCECGCGLEAPKATETNRRRGHIKGQPIRFIKGHSIRAASAARTGRGVWPLENVNGCYEWRGSISNTGHGSLTFLGKRSSAHAHVYRRLVGEIPKGMYVDHKCQNRKCVNPRHLRVVTPTISARENSDRARLNDEAVKVLRFLHKRGTRTKRLAQVYGIAYTTIQQAISGYTWGRSPS